MGKKRRSSPTQRLAGWVAFGLVVAAVVKELRTPRGQRTWTGTVAGFVPYDLRVPTPEKIRNRMWAPDDARLLVPQAFGVGWTINVGRAYALIRQQLSK